MWTHVDRGKGGQKRDFFVDVINGWPYILARGNIMWQIQTFGNGGAFNMFSSIYHVNVIVRGGPKSISKVDGVMAEFAPLDPPLTNNKFL